MTVVLVALFGVLALAPLRAARCNWRAFRAQVSRSPIDAMPGLDRLTPGGTDPVPRRWKSATLLTSAQQAEAYALLAEDRRNGWTLGGELLLLGASAGLGTLLPRIASDQWSRYLVWAPILIGAAGVLARYRATHIYAPLIAIYHHRALHLTRPTNPQRRTISQLRRQPRSER